MSNPSPSSERRLRIVHLFRSPVGGLFRHVLDLARAQIARGDDVGLIVDASTGGERAEAVLARLAPDLALGLARLPMHRDPHPMDALAVLRTQAVLHDMKPDVVHGHGAKGGLYARLPGLWRFGGGGPLRAYTPHGGSLHYDPASLKGAVVMRMERMLARRTDVLLFESGFAAERFRAAVGPAPGLVRVVHNGLDAAEFVPITPDADAADLLFVGELRELKGVDVLLEAIALLKRRGGPGPSAVLVGAGPDQERFASLAQQLGLADTVAFRPPMPAREAFRLGRTLVVPSRAESLPYIVLEAAAARMPIVASRVGGIPEIIQNAERTLVPPGDPAALAHALADMLAGAPAQRRRAADALAVSVEARFSAARMADQVLASYRDALAARGAGLARPPAHPAPRSPRYGL